MNPRRFFAVFCLLLIAGVTVGASLYFWQARQEYQQLAKAQALVHQKLTEAKARLEKQQAELERLRTDPAYVELKIRQRLGYAKPGEIVFKFED